MESVTGVGIGIGTLTTQNNDNDTKNDDENSISIASSISSIPLKDLKQHLADKTKKAKKSNNTKDIKKSSTKNNETSVNTKRKRKNTSISKSTTTTKSTILQTNDNKNKNENKIRSITNQKLKSKEKQKPRPKAKAKEKSTITERDRDIFPKREQFSFSSLPFAPTISSSKQKKILQEGGLSRNEDESSSSSIATTKEKQEAACCLCYCGVDCADRALFFPEDREKELAEDEEEDDYYFDMNDPYLPMKAYDSHNALVYCDGCDRLYHQKCHFVPLLVIPRGDWHCLICQMKHTPRLKKVTSKKNDALTDSNILFDLQEQYGKAFLSRNLYPNTPLLFDETEENSDSYNYEVSVANLHLDFERRTGTIKARLWSNQIKQFGRFLKSQASKVRQANIELETLVSTKRNRQHYLKTIHGPSPQQLVDTLRKLVMAKWKIRCCLLSLEQYRLNDNAHSCLILATWMEQIMTSNTDNGHNAYKGIQSHLFPFGKLYFDNHRRVIPRTKEWEESHGKVLLDIEASAQEQDKDLLASKKKDDPSIPDTISVPPQLSHSSPSSPRSKQRIVHLLENSKIEKRNFNQKKGSQDDQDSGDDDDSSSGISLDDLKCCVCLIGEATDENDLILCDGRGCCRAFHMNCISPPMKDLGDDNDDWFCPLCSSVSTLLHDVQEACFEEDHGMKSTNASVQSWQDVFDVFPSAEWEYETSHALKAGVSSPDTSKFLALYLGEDFLLKNVNTNGDAMNDNGMPIGSDSEDENDYSLFDEDSFDNQRNGNRDGDSSEENSSKSTRSSQATLQDMSSVELEIDKDELAALSTGSQSSNSETNSSQLSSMNHESDDRCDKESLQKSFYSRKRKSRRLTSKQRHGTSIKPSIQHDISGDFDERNILYAKRKRKPVDYQKLNDVLFGNISAAEQAKLDDKIEYKEK